MKSEGGKSNGRRPAEKPEKNNLGEDLVALIIAAMAFQRTGGTKDLRKTTAELVAKMEKRMREEASKVEKEKLQQ